MSLQTRHTFEINPKCDGAKVFPSLSSQFSIQGTYR